jgi:hypothetical protein
MGTALVVGDRMQFVEDQGVYLAEPGPAGLRGEQQIEGLGRGDQDMGRRLRHIRTFAGRGVAGTHAYADLRQGCAGLVCQSIDLGQGFDEIALDVVGQRLERRDVHDAGALRQSAVQRGADEGVETREEGGQSLAGSSGRGYEGMPALRDGFPTLDLGIGRRIEATCKPGPDQRVEL